MTSCNPSHPARRRAVNRARGPYSTLNRCAPSKAARPRILALCPDSDGRWSVRLVSDPVVVRHTLSVDSPTARSSSTVFRDVTTAFRDIRAQRLRDEVGTIYKQAGLPVALVYPSPYHVGMSSLGFQTIYRQLNAAARPLRRARLPARRLSRGPPPARAAVHLRVGRARSATSRWWPSRSPTSSSWPGWSTASIWPASRRSPPTGRGAPPPPARGGGRAAHLLQPCPRRSLRRRDRDGRGRGAGPGAARGGRRLPATAARCWPTSPGAPASTCPASTARPCPPVAAAADSLLPAYSQIRTPHTELSNMFLIEPERGCHRGCTYCVMRRSTNGGMRLVAPEDRAGPGPGRRPPGRPGGRRGHRPPEAAGDPARAGRRRPRGRHLQPARRPAQRRDRRACSSAAATARSPPPRTAPPSACAPRSSARPTRSTCCARPSCAAATSSPSSSST